MLPFLSKLQENLPVLERALDLVTFCKENNQRHAQFKKETKKQIDALVDSNLVLQLHQLKPMKRLTVVKCKQIVAQINQQMDVNCEADIKSVTLISDEKLEYSRDRRFKDIAPDGKTKTKKLMVYEDTEEITSVLPASKYSRVKKQRERAKQFGIKVSKNGTIATTSVLGACKRVHGYAAQNNNTLVKDNGREFYLFSGDGLGTGRGESSNLASVQLGRQS